MTYLLLWAAIDKPTLFEFEEFETWAKAEARLNECHISYPWNTYKLVRVEQTKIGTNNIPDPLGGGTITVEQSPPSSAGGYAGQNEPSNGL